MHFIPDPRRRWLAALALLLGLGASSPPAMAWNSDPNLNTPVCTAPGDQVQPDIATDGAGGVFIVWEDARGAQRSIYAQRLDAYGAALWTTNGILVTSASQDQLRPRVVSDGMGGAIVVWNQQAGTQVQSNLDIRAQRLAPDGAHLWAAGGVPVCVALQDEFDFDVVTDEVGGAYVIWLDLRHEAQNDPENAYVYAQRILPSGIVSWTADGLRVGTNSRNGSPRLVRSSSGGVLAVAVRDPSSGQQMRGFRIDPNGTMPWSISGADLRGTGYSPRIVSDGKGGAIVAWLDTGTTGPIAQRVLPTGEIVWDSHGVRMSDQAEPGDLGMGFDLRADGSGGAIVAWRDDRSDPGDVYGQRVDSLSVRLWNPTGSLLVSGPGAQGSPRLAPDGQGGWFLSALSGPAGDTDVFAQRLTPTGGVIGPASGVQISNSAGTQDSCRVVADQTLGAIAAWSDARTPANGRDIYATRLTPAPGIGDPPRVLSIDPPQSLPGASISLLGSGFTGATEVRFGGVPTAFTFVSDGELQTTAVGCTEVSVRAPAGLSLGGPVALQPPTVTGVSPNAATVLTAVRITGTCFEGVTSVLFNGSPAASFAAASREEIVAVVPGGATTGPITLTNGQGSSVSTGYFTVLQQAGASTGCYFAPPFPAYATAAAPSDLALADLNLDLRPDLIVSEPAAGTVAVRLGAGDGSFGAAAHYSAGTTPGSIAIADFNGDTRPDVVVSNQAAGTVSVLLTQPSGIPGPPQAFAAGGTVVRVVAADLDANGAADVGVLMANAVVGSLRVLPGTGAGGLLPVLVIAERDAVDLAAGDVSGDGRPELVLFDSNARVFPFVNQGGFVFQAAGQQSPNGINGGRSLILADVTLDGRLDAVGVGGSQPGLCVWPGLSSGAFDGVVPGGAIAVGTSPRDVTACDINQDGLLDLAVADDGTDRIRLLVARGDGSFETILQYASPMLDPTGIVAADLDRDGRTDLVALSSGLASASTMLNFGANDLFCPPVRTFAALETPRDLVALDYNEDGLLDLAAADSAGRRIDLWPGVGNGTFGALSTTQGTHNDPAAIATADFNGDSNPDLAVTGNSEIEVFLSNGAGGFLGRLTSNASADDGLAVGHLDADADVDAVIALPNLSIMSGTGTGTFTRTIVSAGVGASPRRPALGDLNADGKLDLVVADAAGGVRTLLGNGNGTFGAPSTALTAAQANFVALADVDGDLKLDAVVTHASAATLSLLPGLGNGQFGARRDFPALPSARSVTLGDVNGDGWPDAVVTHPTSGTVSLFLNARDGGFTPRKDLAYFGSPVAAVIRDFDGDFKNDLAVAEINHNRVSVILNRGDFQAGTWLGGGIALGPGNGFRFAPVEAPDGANGALIAWRELRGNGEFDLYAQRLTSSGTIAPNWPVNGLLITNAPGDQLVHGIVADDLFGAIVAWSDGRTPANGLDVYVQRADSAAVLRWAPFGVALCTAPGDQIEPAVVRDGQGGAIACWLDLRNGSPRYFVQRVDATGTPQWMLNGVPLSSVTGIHGQATMVSDLVGGVYVAWTEGEGPSRDIVAQHIDAGGTALWGPGGIVVCGAAGPQSEPEAITDEFGNLIVTWTDERSGDADLYWQRLDGLGNLAWPVNGLQGEPVLGGQRQATMVSDSRRGGIVGWTDERAGDQDVYASRLDENGQVDPTWPAGGVPIATGGGDQYAPQAIPDGEGGAIFFWRDTRNGNIDLYAQRVTAFGTLAESWTLNGIAVCEVLGEQTSQSAVSDGSGGGIAVWQDGRSDTTTIFAARIDGSGDAVTVAVPELRGDNPMVVRFSGPWPNPASASARFAIDLPTAGDVRLDIFDVAGRRLRTIAPGSRLPAGHHAIVWNGQTDGGIRAPSGVYFARLRAGTTTLTRRCVLLR